MIRFSLKVFAVPLVFSLVSYLVSFVFSFYVIRPLPPSSNEIFVYRSVLHALQFSLVPVLLFVVSYSVGKRTELGDDFFSVITSLLLGSLVVAAVSWSILPFFLEEIQPYPIAAYVTDSVVGSLSDGLELFFVSFAAMAIADLRKRGKVEGFHRLKRYS